MGTFLKLMLHVESNFSAETLIGRSTICGESPLFFQPISAWKESKKDVWIYTDIMDAFEQRDRPQSSPPQDIIGPYFIHMEPRHLRAIGGKLLGHTEDEMKGLIKKMSRDDLKSEVVFHGEYNYGPRPLAAYFLTEVTQREKYLEQEERLKRQEERRR